MRLVVALLLLGVAIARASINEGYLRGTGLAQTGLGPLGELPEELQGDHEIDELMDELVHEIDALRIPNYDIEGVRAEFDLLVTFRAQERLGSGGRDLEDISGDFTAIPKDLVTNLESLYPYLSHEEVMDILSNMRVDLTQGGASKMQTFHTLEATFMSLLSYMEVSRSAWFTRKALYDKPGIGEAAPEDVEDVFQDPVALNPLVKRQVIKTLLKDIVMAAEEKFTPHRTDEQLMRIINCRFSMALERTLKADNSFAEPAAWRSSLIGNKKYHDLDS